MAKEWKEIYCEVGTQWALLHKQDYEWDELLETFEDFDQMEGRLKELMQTVFKTDEDDEGRDLEHIIDDREASFGDITIKIYEATKMHRFPYPTALAKMQ